MENVGKRTPSDPMETGCRGKCPSDCHLSVRERLRKYTVNYSFRGGWKMYANGLHRIRWRLVVVARVHWTAACQFARDLVNIQHTIVVEGVENVCKRAPSDPI